MASGNCVWARKLASEPTSSNNASVAHLGKDMVRLHVEPYARDKSGLRLHRVREVVGNLVEEAGGRQPALVGADQQRKVLGHVAGLDGVDTDLLQREGELRQLRIVVEFGAVAETTRPGEDRGDRV